MRHEFGEALTDCLLWYVFCFVFSSSKKALKSILQKCTYLPALEPFLYNAPSNILKHVVGQFSKVRRALSLQVGEENENEVTCFFWWSRFSSLRWGQGSPT